jgi:hypothetical protein
LGAQVVRQPVDSEVADLDDCTPPIDTNVSQPSASASATKYSGLRTFWREDEDCESASCLRDS